MNTNHNRIKVADLEKNVPEKILTTNNDGELEFTDISTLKINSYNALDYNVEGKALDARQGKILKDLIDSINRLLVSDHVNLKNIQELADAIEIIQNSLNNILVNDLTSGGSTKALTAEMGKNLQNNKVDKINGKSLLSDTEIARLGTLSNYEHPENHPATIILQDPNNRLVSDTEKAIWNAKQSSLGFTPENVSNKNSANGYAGLGVDGKLIASQLPSITVNDTFVIASQAAMLSLKAETGDIAVRTDLSKSFILKGLNSATLADWQELLTPTSAVTTVFGRNGAITSQTGDYSADQIAETTSRKFQSANQQLFNDATSSIQTQLNSKASATGSGASGTWPINVTGNANTTGGLAVHSSTNNEPNKIVRTDSNGYIQAGWINTISGDNGTNTINRIYASNDQYLRYYTPANFIKSLGLATTETNRWYDGWVTAPGYDANTIAENKSGFSYSNNCPLSGQLIHFGSGGYSLQLNANYGSGIADVRFRTHNGDINTWGDWGRFLTNGNYASYSAFSGIVSSGNGFQTANYATNTRNRIWSFGDADQYGLSYFQGTSGQYGTDSIGIHFGNATNAASKFIFASNGDLKTTGLTSSTAFGVTQTDGSGQGLSLYAGAVNGKPAYGLMFATTSNYGGYGAVNGDWATYLTMDGATNRGWIFRSINTNVASISATGAFTGSNFIGPLSGNASTSTLSSQLNWTNYGGGHTIFDASSSLSPAGTSVNNANSQIAWTATYPSLMGWNGSNTYGVRVDSSRISDRSTRANGNFYIDDNYGNGIVGVYSSTRYQGIYAMGDAYKLAADGSATNDCYGLAWTHPNVGGQSKAGLSHQLLVMEAGTTKTAIGTGIWTSGSVTGSRFAAGFDAGVANSFSCDGWFRSGGSSGWYNSSYGGGIWMQNTTNVEIYGNKQLLVNNNITATGDVIAYYSDERLKTRKGNIINAIDKIKTLNGFYYKNNSLAKSFGYKCTDLQIGLSAQEVKEILPEVVTMAPFDREITENGTEISKSGENYLTVNYAKIVPLLVEAIKEQQSQIDFLLTKIGK
ncbi:tail fiber domain-containing protein [Flavobacterium collinsii]|uniref:Peptidase S74 domain-containing protein n=1 Tax=Flavobacterium collinsii TaxID=1114861 RepID=A0A9W4TJ16_9FLAO|nr:tail fiber domain-containing protein [Flavobacterium collinsii]CAI2769164.1 Peptidase S74 domain-containing protein [Flavobacterium collinsii]